MRNLKLQFTKIITGFLLLIFGSLNSMSAQNWDWDWNGDTLDLGLPCDSLIQFECNGETIELSACDIDWVVLQDCFFNNDYDDWDGYEDSIDYENYYDWDWDWFGDTLDLGLPCDSLIQFECNGETIEFSACDIDWEVLEDCTAAALEDGLPQQDMFDNDEPQQFETKSNGGDANNPIVNEVYPNPVVNNLYIDVTTYEPGSIEFIVIDAKGSLVHQEQMELSGGGKYVLPINFETKLRKGMYILNIVNESNQIIKTQSLIVAE